MSIGRGEGTRLIVASVILWTLSTIAVLLRVISIRVRKTGWKNHDYLTALALVCCLLPPCASRLPLLPCQNILEILTNHFRSLVSPDL